MIDEVVRLRALETSAFIIARPTEGSMDYLLPTKSNICWVQLLC